MYFDFDVVDISELSFRYKRQIHEGNYILEGVDGFNPLNNNTSKVRLLKDEAPTSTQADKITQASLETGDAVQAGGGSGGTGGGSGGSGGGSQKQYFRQWFYSHTSATMEITLNSGVLPSNEAQIEVFDSSNGQVISPSFWSVSGSIITLSFTPTGEDYYVNFSYP